MYCYSHQALPRGLLDRKQVFKVEWSGEIFLIVLLSV